MPHFTQHFAISVWILKQESVDWLFKPFKGNYCSLENSLEKLQQKMPTSKCPLSIKTIFDEWYTEDYTFYCNGFSTQFLFIYKHY